MNAGTDYHKARAQAQMNADLATAPRWLHGYNGVWWISKTPVQDAERIDPTSTGCIDCGKPLEGRLLLCKPCAVKADNV